METFLDDLRESNEFLNLLLDNINSAVLIIDEEFRIHQFNGVFHELFDRASNRIVQKTFGDVTGCVNAVIENKPCGETSKCSNCILRRSLVETMARQVPADNLWLERVFYINGEPVEKYFEFSTRHVIFKGRKMVLVIIYDVTEIEKQRMELERKQSLLETDMSAAAGIQQSLLPECSPDIDPVQVAWRFEPCQQIGGDIFNIHSADEKHISLYMLDVCGHGVPAALISVSVSQFLQSSRIKGGDCFLAVSSPEDILNDLNEAFPFERFDNFFSIVFLTIDFRRNRLIYSSAGHPCPILLGGDGRLESLGRHGPVIGLHDGRPFTRAERELEKGDRLVLYTDGILDTENSRGDRYGKARFYEALQRYSRDGIQRFVDSVYADSKIFGESRPPEDDISLMAVDYHT